MQWRGFDPDMAQQAPSFYKQDTVSVLLNPESGDIETQQPRPINGGLPGKPRPADFNMSDELWMLPDGLLLWNGHRVP